MDSIRMNESQTLTFFLINSIQKLNNSNKLDFELVIWIFMLNYYLKKCIICILGDWCTINETNHPNVLRDLSKFVSAWT